MQVFDFELSAEDMKVIESFHIPYRVCVPMVEVSWLNNSQLLSDIYCLGAETSEIDTCK